MNHLETIRCRVEEVMHGPLVGPGLVDLRPWLDAIQHPNSINDRLMLLEKALALMSRLGNSQASPEHKKIAADIQGLVIQLLYKDLPHPPSGYLALPPPNAAFIPGKSVKYAYRPHDGSNCNPLLPTLGMAGMPYATSVPSHCLTNFERLPDPGLVFDTLLRRPKAGANEDFVRHPAGVSSLFFAFADLIIHDIFYTNRDDPTINNTSSYLDLSVLYGNNKEKVDSVRRKDGTGKLWEDVFADERLLLMPPATCALLVLFCRNHNYIAEKILAINERGTFLDPNSLTSHPEKIESQDDEIFHRARLVNSAYFVKIILGDYVGAILGQVRDGSNWRLDPLAEIRQLDHAPVPRGKGNVISVEFNLLYRWHAALSSQDTEWTRNLFRSALKDIGKEDLPFDELDPQTFGRAAANALAQKTQGGVQNWTFEGLTRSETTKRFSDSDLARILQDATSYSAAAFGARGIPEVLRVIEILGIEQAREWGTCSLNEFRKFIGLKPYASFEEWNPDGEIAAAARSLYDHIDNLELHVGMQAEATKSPGPGAGLCPGYTISRAILSDATILTRGDRFLTTDFTPFNLTTWGYYDCQYSATLHPDQPNPDGSYGGMLTKLLFRHFPAFYPVGSAYAHFPFLVPDDMKEQTKKRLGEDSEEVHQYLWTRPSRPIGPVAEGGRLFVVKSYKGACDVLESAVWQSRYTPRLAMVVGQHGETPEDSMKLTKDLINKKSSRWAEYFMKTTQALIKERSIKRVGSSPEGTGYIDIVRDVIKILPVRWICEQLAALPLPSKGGKTEAEYAKMMEDVCRYVYLVNPENDWQLRENSVQFFRIFEKCVVDRLKRYSSFVPNTASLILPLDTMDFLKGLHKKGFQAGKSSTELAAALFCEAVPTVAHWAKCVAQVVDYYLGDEPGTKEERENIVKSWKGGKGMEEKGNLMKIAELVKKVLVADPPVSGTYRTALKDTDILGPGGKRVEAGESVLVSIVDANKDRPENGVGIIEIGKEGLVSADLFEAIMPVVVATILSMPNLQRAPGKCGKYSKFTEDVVGVPENVFIDACGRLSPFPASLVVEYTYSK